MIIQNHTHARATKPSNIPSNTNYIISPTKPHYNQSPLLVSKSNTTFFKNLETPHTQTKKQNKIVI